MMLRTRYLLLLLTAAALVLSGCGGSKIRHDKNADGSVQVTGKISVRGSSPGSLILLEARDGKLYEVQASAIGEELRSLSGMDVAIDALVVPGYDQQEPVLAVRTYDILTLPSGERPIVGFVQINAQDVWLVDQNEVTWVVIGDFVEVFRTFPGSKVWVVGVTQQRLDTRVSSLRTLHITEYGVIRP